MELKRNPLGQLTPNQHKQSQIMQPFINISKASTPVRTRVVPPGSQMNSTPINLNKIVGNLHKSPNNKQNHHSNYRKNQTRNDFASKVQGNQSDQQNRVNLSPILALNRKFNEGPKCQPKKSLTPENHKANEDYDGFANEIGTHFQKQYASNASLHDSKASNFNSTTNLRGSNCFKALIENRCKSPNRFENSNGKPLQKRESTPSLKESLGSNHLFRNFGQETKAKLTESKSFDQLRGINNNRLAVSQIKCMNNDGKKAKYIVVNSEDERFGPERGHLYFCSKCTIPLVQNGFIVEEITKESGPLQSSQGNRYQDYKYRLQARRKEAECYMVELSEREEEQLNRLEEYYQQVFAFLEQQRYTDRKRIEECYKEKKAEPFAYCKEINRWIQDIDEVVSSPKQRGLRVSQIEEIASSPATWDKLDDFFILEGTVQELLGKFAKTFQSSLKLNLGKLKRGSLGQFSKGNDVAGNRNHAMRFSFEKLLGGSGDNGANAKCMRRQAIDPLIEQEEEYAENEVQPQKQEHEAFRDLFPEEEETRLINNDIHSPTFKNI